MNTDKDTNQILSAIEEALRDGVVSRSELQTIRGQVEALELPFERMALLRSEVVKLLQARMPDEQSRTIITWLDKITRFLPTEPGKLSPEQTSQVFFAPGDDCHQALFSVLDGAMRSLDICVFTITDDQITARIRNAVRRNVSVRIITDDDKALDLGSDVHDLWRSGLNVRVDNTIAHMHHKFAIVDGRKVITGSFNWTRGAGLNHENLFICSEQKTVATYQSEFNRLWESMFSL